MADTVASSDVGIGLGMFFGVIAVLAAVGMYVAVDDQVVAGWSFAAAVTAGALSVAAVHLFGGHRE